MIVPARTPDEKNTLVSWLAGKIGTSADDLVGDVPYQVLGVLRTDGALMGAVMFNHYRGARVEVSCAGEPGWVTRGDMRLLFDYPFRQLGCWSLLSMVARNNKPVREMIGRLGFRELCVIPGGRHPSQSAVLYCMTRPECRWIQPERLH